jgi:hypothetical protein
VLESDAERNMDELRLAYHITLCQPADLSFAYRMHCLVAFDGPPGSFRRPESEAGITLDSMAARFLSQALEGLFGVANLATNLNNS